MRKQERDRGKRGKERMSLATRKTALFYVGGGWMSRLTTVWKRTVVTDMITHSAEIQCLGQLWLSTSAVQF